MRSPLWIGLHDKVSEYRTFLIAEKDDIDCGNEEQVKAIAFRILASAAIEEFVEDRCKMAARLGMDRLKKGLTTATGRSLVVWSVSRNNPGWIPIHDTDIADYYPDYDSFLTAYLDSVSSNHGLNSRDLAKLVHPVGLRQHQIPSGLFDRVQALADRRDPVVHTSLTRARSQVGPQVESKQIFDIIDLLSELDEALHVAVHTYPLKPEGV